MSLHEPEYFTTEVNDTRITVFGSQHTARFFDDENNAELLERLLDEADHLAWEFAAFKPEYEEGDILREDLNTSYEEFTDKVCDMAADHHTEIWGVDYTEDMRDAYVIGSVSFMTPVLAPIYLLGREAVKNRLKEEREPKDLSRRSLLKGAAKMGGAMTPGYLAFGDALTEGIVPENLENKAHTGTLGDIRECYGAEMLDNISERKDGKILAIYGGNHSESVFDYLENPEQRRQKLDLYEPLRTKKAKYSGLWQRNSENKFEYRGEIKTVD